MGKISLGFTCFKRQLKILKKVQLIKISKSTVVKSRDSSLLHIYGSTQIPFVTLCLTTGINLKHKTFCFC